MATQQGYARTKGLERGKAGERAAHQEELNQERAEEKEEDSVTQAVDSGTRKEGAKVTKDFVGTAGSKATKRPNAEQ